MNDQRQFSGLSGATRTRPDAAGHMRGANILDAGEHNKQLALQIIRAHGRISRKAIAGLIGLTHTAVHKITRELAADYLIVPADRTAGDRGKPTISWKINPERACSLGFNVDRDHLTLVMLDFAGQVVARHHKEIRFADPETARTFFSAWIAELRTHEPARFSRIAGAGLAIPDLLGKTSLPGQPDSYAAWSEAGNGGLLSDLLDVPVCVENDAAAAAIGEMHFGGGLESNSFFYVLISAGLGGGLIINRQYYRGAHGRSGEFGFLPQIHPFRPRLSRLDKVLGDTLLLSDLYEKLQDAGIEASSPADLADLPLAGQDCVRAWISSVADYLYLPLLSVMYCIDPDAIYVGGRLPRAVLEPLCLEISTRLSINMGADWPEPVVRQAVLAQDAPAIGAAVLALQSFCGQYLRTMRNGTYAQSIPAPAEIWRPTRTAEYRSA